MYKNILLGVDTTLKNEKALEEISKLAGENTVVTIFNSINEQDAQASIKSGVHIDKLVNKRSEGLASTRETLDSYGIEHDEVIVRGNAKVELVKQEFVYEIYEGMLKSEICLDLIFNSYIRYMKACINLKVILNLIYNSYMRYMKVCINLTIV